MHHHTNTVKARISYVKLKDTVTVLDRTRQARTKYRDVGSMREESYIGSTRKLIPQPISCILKYIFES